jgi:hypothetical protein
MVKKNFVRFLLKNLGGFTDCALMFTSTGNRAVIEGVLRARIMPSSALLRR